MLITPEDLSQITHLISTLSRNEINVGISCARIHQNCEMNMLFLPGTVLKCNSAYSLTL